MNTHYFEDQTVELEYRDDVDLTNAACSIEVERYLGPLHLPAEVVTLTDVIPDGNRAYWRGSFEPGYYTYRFKVELSGNVSVVEGRFMVA